MKTLLLAATCAALVLGASTTVFAANVSVPASATQAKSMSQQTAVALHGADRHGVWPDHWTKDQERLATVALNDLEDHGYAQFSNFHKKGDQFEASVMQGGKSMQVLVDPINGNVTQEM